MRSDPPVLTWSRQPLISTTLNVRLGRSRRGRPTLAPRRPRQPETECLPLDCRGRSGPPLLLFSTGDVGVWAAHFRGRTGVSKETGVSDCFYATGRKASSCPPQGLERALFLGPSSPPSSAGQGVEWKTTEARYSHPTNRNFPMRYVECCFCISTSA